MIAHAGQYNATFIMKIAEYTKKKSDIFQDDCYKLTARDPTTFLEITTKTETKSSRTEHERKI